MCIMFFWRKVLALLFWITISEFAVFSMDTPESLKNITLNSASVEMTAVTTSPPIESDTLLDNKSITARGFTYERTASTRNSIDPVLFGNTEISFSNPTLEYYTKKSAICWNFIYSWLEDLEYLFLSAGTGLTVCTQFVKNDYKTQFVVYAIQASMVANTLHKFHSFAQKVVAIREKQALMYEAHNALNKQRDEDQNAKIFINGIEASKNKEVFASKGLASYFNCCATCRNIMWDQVGAFAILCEASSSSILNFSQTVDVSKRPGYFLVATLFGLAGTFFHSYAKILANKTKEAEKKANASANYIRYKEGIQHKEAAATSNNGDADNDDTDMV